MPNDSLLAEMLSTPPPQRLSRAKTQSEQIHPGHSTAECQPV